MKQDKGFTLIELLVVVAIIAILVTIALAMFNGGKKETKTDCPYREVSPGSWEARC